MSLTIHALKFAIGVSLTLCFAQSYGSGQAEQQVLDLTKQPISEIESMGVPGETVGGMVGKPTKSGYELPVRLNTKQFRLSGNSVALEVQLTNTSEGPLSIPSCPDGHRAFQSHAVDRHSLEFGLAVESSSADRHIVEPVEVTFGSSRPECSTRLEPNRTLLIIMEARIPERILEMRKHTAHISARVFVDEIRFEDDRYYVKDRSGRVESQPIEVSF